MRWIEAEYETVIEQRLRGESSRQVRRPAPIGAQDAALKVLRVFVGLTLAIATAALAVAALGLTRPAVAPQQVNQVKAQTRLLRAQVNQQRRDIAGQRRTIAGLKRSRTPSQVNGLGLDDDRLSSAVRTLSVCLPELQAELDGMRIRFYVNNIDARRDSLSIDRPTTISSACAPTLLGGSSR